MSQNKLWIMLEKFQRITKTTEVTLNEETF